MKEWRWLINSDNKCIPIISPVEKRIRHELCFVKILGGKKEGNYISSMSSDQQEIKEKLDKFICYKRKMSAKKVGMEPEQNVYSLDSLTFIWNRLRY